MNQVPPVTRCFEVMKLLSPNDKVPKVRPEYSQWLRVCSYPLFLLVRKLRTAEVGLPGVP